VAIHVKIALLEDDAAQAELTLQWLSENNVEARHASNCQRFLTLFNEHLPDLAILDWELPDGSGIEVLQALRNKRNSKIPILFTTQRDNEEDIVAALKNGAHDYLNHCDAVNLKPDYTHSPQVGTD
jgi:DNA-binding response OmpR family regulator